MTNLLISISETMEEIFNYRDFPVLMFWWVVAGALVSLVVGHWSLFAGQCVLMVYWVIQVADRQGVDSE